MKSCVADVNALLYNTIETCDSLITITMKKHLAEKPRPVFAMLKRIEGVSESSSLPKQGGDPVKQFKKENTKQAHTTVKPLVKPKSENEMKNNESSGSKGKETINDERIINDSEE
ncbi:unnamed protein product [Lactuca saligna]|uniref:Uncharacterized protein n=1 Tax=Lactuca saligna TaxID=75948 RepID=A0AA36ECF5_LACSI|nr:unnamed protein product [Lactuca saligna]